MIEIPLILIWVIMLSLFRLAKVLESLVQIAEEAVANINKPDFIDEIKSVSGYINFYK